MIVNVIGQKKGRLCPYFSYDLFLHRMCVTSKKFIEIIFYKKIFL